VNAEPAPPTEVEEAPAAAAADDSGSVEPNAQAPEPAPTRRPRPTLRFHVDERTGEFTHQQETPRQRLQREALEREVELGNALDEATRCDPSLAGLRGTQVTELVRGKLETAKDLIGALQKDIKDTQLVPETAAIAALVVGLARVWRIAHDLEASGKHLKDPDKN